jgi:hypothetical protein
MFNKLKILLSNSINNNSNFKKWFKYSITIKNGEPMIFYHGSSNSFNIFKINRHKYGKSIFFTEDINTAKYFGKNIYEVYLKIENLFDYKDSNCIEYIINKFNNIYNKNIENKNNGKEYYDIKFSKDIIINFIKEGRWDFIEEPYILPIIKKKYDGYIIVENNKENWSVFNSNQIKSINNDGSYDIEDPNIYS